MVDRVDRVGVDMVDRVDLGWIVVSLVLPPYLWHARSRNLQVDPDTLFSEFDDVPLASGSVAQVHRARLATTGEAVAGTCDFSL